MRIDITQKLRTAVQEGKLGIVKDCLVNDKVDLANADTPNGWTSLHYAVRYDHAQVVSFLLESGHERYGVSVDNEGKTPLMIAAIHNCGADIAKLLVQVFPDSILRTSQEGLTALLYAARHGNEQAIEVLLDHGADINGVDDEGSTALHHAAAWGQYKAVKLLIAKGCKTAVKNHAGWTPPDFAYSTQLKAFLEECARSAFEDRRTERRRNNTGACTPDFSFEPVLSRKRLPSSPVTPQSYSRSTSLPFAHSRQSVDATERESCLKLHASQSGGTDVGTAVDADVEIGLMSVPSAAPNGFARRSSQFVNVFDSSSSMLSAGTAARNSVNSEAAVTDFGVPSKPSSSVDLGISFTLLERRLAAAGTAIDPDAAHTEAELPSVRSAQPSRPVRLSRASGEADRLDFSVDFSERALPPLPISATTVPPAVIPDPADASSERRPPKKEIPSMTRTSGLPALKQINAVEETGLSGSPGTTGDYFGMYSSQGTIMPVPFDPW